MHQDTPNGGNGANGALLFESCETARRVIIRLMHYNFVKIHMSLKVTPAMAAGVTTRLWEISDIVALIDA